VNQAHRFEDEPLTALRAEVEGIAALGMGAELDPDSDGLGDLLRTTITGDGQGFGQGVASVWGWAVPAAFRALRSARACCHAVNAERLPHGLFLLVHRGVVKGQPNRLALPHKGKTTAGSS